MILTREMVIKINESNYRYYEDMGYDTYIGDVLTIPIDILSTGSNYKIDCECDKCGIKKEVVFKNYIKYVNNGTTWGEYYCRKCSDDKRKKTLIENYGTDCPLKNKNIMDKKIKSCLEKYGFDNSSKSEIVKNKIKESIKHNKSRN